MECVILVETRKSVKIVNFEKVGFSKLEIVLIDPNKIGKKY